MLTKFWSLSSFIAIWLILVGLPEKAFDACMLTSCVAISYYFASYLTILPKKILLNYSGICYFLRLLLEIIKSSISVMKIIWSVKMKVDAEFRWVEAGDDEVFLMLYANSITLTPGTITAGVKNNMLLVHALSSSSFDELVPPRKF